MIRDLAVQKKFGDWSVLRWSHRIRRPGGRWRNYWLCRCACGIKTAVEHDSLMYGNTRRCRACAAKVVGSGVTHGYLRGGKVPPEYGSWCQAKARCYNPNDSGYRNYGGRGIIMCGEWRNDFSGFFRDMGQRPSPKHTLDRIDNDGNYEPGNCRWATRAQQRHNQRRVKLTTKDIRFIRRSGRAGHTKASLARRYGLSTNAIYAIVHRKSYRDVK